MTQRQYNIAVEMTSRQGQISLGVGDELLATLNLPHKHRHGVELTPTIAALLTSHDLRPADLAQMYISIGPGSFTGLRIAVATAKMLNQTLGTKLVAVPTLQVVAANVPADVTPHLAVCLNLKGATVYAGLFDRQNDRWTPSGKPLLTTLPELLADGPRPMGVLCDPRPAAVHEVDGVKWLAASWAQPRSDAVWQIARTMAKQGQFIDADKLTPLYVRPPEAEEVWARRHATPAQKAAAR